jgi:hypothetical protein
MLPPLAVQRFVEAFLNLDSLVFTIGLLIAGASCREERISTPGHDKEGNRK